MALALVLTWTITAGLVFAILVWQAGVRGIRIDVPWSDQVLHFYLPAVTVAAWALAPGIGPCRGVWFRSPSCIRCCGVSRRSSVAR